MQFAYNQNLFQRIKNTFHSEFNNYHKNCFKLKDGCKSFSLTLDTTARRGKCIYDIAIHNNVTFHFLH